MSVKVVFLIYSLFWFLLIIGTGLVVLHFERKEQEQIIRKKKININRELLKEQMRKELDDVLL